MITGTAIAASIHVPNYDFAEAYAVDTSINAMTTNNIFLFCSALQAQSKLGGEGLLPFYGLMDGGRDGDLFHELEDYFYYAQLRRYEW